MPSPGPMDSVVVRLVVTIQVTSEPPGLFQGSVGLQVGLGGRLVGLVVGRGVHHGLVVVKGGLHVVLGLSVGNVE